MLTYIQTRLENAWVRAVLVSCFAVMVGLISVLPSLLAVNALKDQYQGIPFMYNNDEDHYLARVHEMADGHYAASSMFYYEYKDIYSMVPPINETLFYLASRTLGLMPHEFLTLAKFIYPALLFFLVYLVFTAWTKQYRSPVDALWGGVATAIIVTLGIGFINYHQVINTFTNLHSQLVLAMWTRPVNPVTGALFIFFVLYLLKKFESNWSIAKAIFVGLIIGCSAGYLFSYELLFVILISSVGSFILLKQRTERNYYLIIAGTALLLPLLYWFDIAPHLAEGNIGARNGIIYTHLPILNKVLLLTTLLYIFVLFLRRSGSRYLSNSMHNDRPILIFSAVLLVAMYAVYNKQILLGLSVWPYHFSFYTNVLCVLVISLLMYVYVRPKFVFWWYGITTVMILAPIVFMTVTALTGYKTVLADFTHLQNLQPVVTWLNENAPQDCVVLVSEDLREQFTKLIPAFTACNVYRTNNLFGVVPMERVYHNFYVRLRLEDVDPDTIEAYLRENGHEIRSSFYKDWDDLSVIPKPIDESLIQELAAGYTTFSKEDFATQLQKYRLDYVLTTHDATDTINELDGLIKVFTVDQNIGVYAFPSLPGNLTHTNQ